MHLIKKIKLQLPGGIGYYAVVSITTNSVTGKLANLLNDTEEQKRNTFKMKIF